MKKFLCIVDILTDQIVHKVDVTYKSESSIDKIEQGMSINLNWDKYRIRLQEQKK